MTNLSFDQAHYETIKQDWAIALMRRGFIVDLKVSYERGTSKLSSSDIGWNDDLSKDEKDYIKLGQKSVFPSEFTKEISQIEKLARKNLSQHSFDTMWGKFVPDTSFETWLLKHEEIKGLFEEFKKATYEKYDLIVEHSRSIYRDLAFKVWNKNYEGEPTESFVSDYVGKALAFFPEKNKLYMSMKMNVKFLQIPLPYFIAENISKAEELLRHNEKMNQEHLLSIRNKDIINNYYLEKKQEFIDSFLKDTVGELRNYVNEYCVTVLEYLEKKDSGAVISNHQKETLLNTIQKFELLNFYNDKDIDQKLKEIRVEISKNGRDVDSKKIKFYINEILNEVSDNLNPYEYKKIISSIEI